jgi:predicted HicB family RNase H-like nuclease
MKYKGYTGIAEFDEASGVIFGRVIGLRDTITFQAESVPELTQAFHDSVDDYLEFCDSRGEAPEKPFSGHFVLRITPDLHRALSNAAEIEDVSLNSLVESILGDAVRMFGTGAPGDAEEVKSEMITRRATTGLLSRTDSRTHVSRRSGRPIVDIDERIPLSVPADSVSARREKTAPNAKLKRKTKSRKKPAK